MILKGLMLGAAPLIDVNMKFVDGFYVIQRNPYLKFQFQSEKFKPLQLP